MIDALVSGKLIEDTEQVRLVSLDTRGRVRERRLVRFWRLWRWPRVDDLIQEHLPLQKL